jgi:hypothetical protein
MDVAQKTFELNNNVQVHTSGNWYLPTLTFSYSQTLDVNDEIFRYDRDEQMALLKAEPWASE